jgi:hypothetical protein
MYKYFISILILCSLFFCSCQKELNFEPSAIINPIDTTQRIDTTYQPVSKNSFWKYKSNNATNDITIITSTGNTLQIDGKSFSIFNVQKNGVPQQDAYFSKTQQDYRLQNIFTRFELTRHKIFTPILYLIDKNPKPYDEWEVDAGTASNNLNAKYKGFVITPSLSVTVNNKKYSNVVLVKIQIFYKLEPNSGYENFQTYYFYLVRGIGIIKAESESAGGGTNSFNINDELIEYKIY